MIKKVVFLSINNRGAAPREVLVEIIGQQGHFSGRVESLVGVAAYCGLVHSNTSDCWQGLSVGDQIDRGA